MSDHTTGKVIVIVAPSGAGKTTLARRLLKEFSDIRFSVSATTRPPRENEVHGEDYYFLSGEEFDQKIKNDAFLEWEFYSGNRYGTLQSEVDKLVETGYFPLLDIEVRGALNIVQMYDSDAVSIFIKPPSMDVLAQRLSGRGSETDETLSKRLSRAEKEMQFANHFDYIVVNDDLDTAFNETASIVKSHITDKS